jgi:hypothetical protein
LFAGCPSGSESGALQDISNNVVIAMRIVFIMPLVDVGGGSV